ncbi:MAG TPA: hypothetical protein PLY93_08685 [Turneriella sp.]|nr:hypothetical protein [Turneriella sp.]
MKKKRHHHRNEKLGTSVAAQPSLKRINWKGESNVEVKYAQCCNPSPPDSISGFISRLGVVSVHKKACPSLADLANRPEQAERIIPLTWVGHSTGRQATVEIVGVDRPQIYLDIVKQLAESGANILEANATTTQVGKIHDLFVIEVDSNEHLTNILKEITTVDGIESAEERFGG